MAEKTATKTPTPKTAEKAPASEPSTNGSNKTACAISRKAFMGQKPVPVTVGENTILAATPKEFSSGTFGYFANEKVTRIIDGVPVKFQLNLIMTAIGSKDAAAE
jgi:hypothetical protein